jgi:hypothetical protein
MQDVIGFHLLAAWEMMLKPFPVLLGLNVHEFEPLILPYYFNFLTITSLFSSTSHF